MSAAPSPTPIHSADVPPPLEHDAEVLVSGIVKLVDVSPVDADTADLTPGRIALGLAGYLALPVVGLLDMGGGGSLGAGVAPPVAALALSVPSLVVGHQFLGLTASPRDLMADVGRVFVQTGRLALGLVPVVGLFAATTGLGPLALVVSLALIGLVSLELARRRLIRRERAATVDRTDVSHGERMRMVLLATAWSVLAFFIAARMGLSFLHSL